MDGFFRQKRTQRLREPCHHASMTEASHTCAGPGAALPLRVLVVDDQELLSRGLCLLLDQVPDIEVVGEASDAAAAVRLVAERLPDVVLLGQGLSVCDSDVCRLIKSTASATRVVLLTGGAEGLAPDPVSRAGADGQVDKDSPIEDVAAVVRLVAHRAAA